jgi:hypothetical protein
LVLAGCFFLGREMKYGCHNAPKNHPKKSSYWSRVNYLFLCILSTPVNIIVSSCYSLPQEPSLLLIAYKLKIKISAMAFKSTYDLTLKKVSNFSL